MNEHVNDWPCLCIAPCVRAYDALDQFPFCRLRIRIQAPGCLYARSAALFALYERTTTLLRVASLNETICTGRSGLATGPRLLRISAGSADAGRRGPC